MLIDTWNRSAVKNVLADAERTVALVNVDDLVRNREIVPDVVAQARRTYRDLLRRSRPLMMNDEEYSVFEGALRSIRDGLKVFGEDL